MLERRREPRLRSLLGGTIVFGERRRSMECLVRNISPHGALIVFAQSAITPSEFALHIPYRREVHAAKVAWRRHDRAGLSLSAGAGEGR
jgi:hypothetical protein